MKLEDLVNLKEELKLWEAPENVFPTDFGLEDEKYNKEFGRELLMDRKKAALEKIGEYTLWEFSRQYALIRDSDNYVAYYMKFKFDNIRLLRRQCVRQVVVWRSVGLSVTEGLAKRIFLKYLIPNYQNVITDAEQTPDGRRFWQDRIGNIIEDKLAHIYYIDIEHPREVTEIFSMSDYFEMVNDRPVYGDGNRYQNRRFVIMVEPFNPQ